MKKFRIAVGRSRLSPTIEHKRTTWSRLVEKLTEFKIADITYEDYIALPRDGQADYKDAGYFVGGEFSGKTRKLSELRRRHFITLDIDHIDPWDLSAIDDAYDGLAYVVHSTIKHCDDTPRLRLVFSLSRPCTVNEYEPLARKIANEIGMDCFDDTTYQSARIMFWPVKCSDGETYVSIGEGDPIDVDKWLRQYDDWQDYDEWPHSSRVEAVRPSGRQAEDPLTKRGIIGAFNRTYDIHAAISAFDLPYEATDHDNRYRPIDATGPSGAVVYDDVFLYSHHESDVVGQRNVNAWDLVRLHLFGHKDQNVDPDTSIMSYPSSKEMAALAGNDPRVAAELKKGDPISREELEGLRDAAPRERTRSDASAQSSGGVDDLTFNSLLAAIARVETQKDSKKLNACKQMVSRIAAARLDPDDVDILCSALKGAYPDPAPSKIALLRAVKVAGGRLTGAVADGGVLKDMERVLLGEALREHWQGGATLKRVGRKCWTYEDGLWAPVGDEPVRGLLGQTFTRLREERPEDMLALVATVGEGKTSSLVRSVWQMLCDDLAKREDRDDPLRLNRSFPLPVVNCRNCELWFDAEGEMAVKDHDPSNFFTVRIDAEYDEGAKCPEWDRFMTMVFSNSSDCADMIRHFEEIGGYVIQYSRWLKTWMLFHGEKDTGKSTAAMVLQSMLGGAYTGKPMSKLDDKANVFAESSLIGKLLMIDDDFSYDGLLPDGFLKTYSEEKPVTASVKYGDDVNFRARAVPLILSNHWPATRDTTGAFIERALLVPFAYRIRGRDQDDQRRVAMLSELPGILNRFLAGLGRLRARGGWDRPLDCVEVERLWARRANPVLQFLSECVDVGRGNPKAAAAKGFVDVKRNSLYDVYFDWCRGQGAGYGRNFAMKKSTFFERVEPHIGKPIKTMGEYFYKKLRLKSSPTEELDEIDDF